MLTRYVSHLPKQIVPRGELHYDACKQFMKYYYCKINIIEATTTIALYA